MGTQSPLVVGDVVRVRAEFVPFIQLSEAHDPNDFHFMRYVRCLDVGVECLGYGEVLLKVKVIPRVK